MKLNTCSEVISFAKKLENDSAKFYRDLCQKFARDEDVLLPFAKENEKNIVTIERAYYGVISDAIEGCFAFNISPEEYAFETGLPAEYPEALKKVMAMENTVVKFYTDAAEQSKSLMADVPRSFTLVAKKRSTRIPRLESLLQAKSQ